MDGDGDGEATTLMAVEEEGSEPEAKQVVS